jgi:hypothetical protein
MAKEDESLVMIAVLTEPLAVDLLLAALPEAMHLRPLWDRLVIVDLPDYVAIGLPIANKVTKDSIENHRRHLFSLLNLLEVPLASSPSHLHQLEVDRDQIRQDVAWPAAKPDKKKKAAEEAAKAAAKAAAEAEEAGTAEGSEAPAAPEAASE